jgi:hypothetical protein
MHTLHVYTVHGEPVSSDYHNKNASRSIVDEIYCRAASVTNSWAHTCTCKVFHVWTHTSEGGVCGGTPAPRRLHGMRGDDKTADAGRGAHCAVRHGSSSNGAGSVGGRAPLFEEKNWLLSKSWQTASQTAISQRRKRRRSASGSVHQCVFFVFFAARGVVQVFSCAECDVLSVHATSIVSQTGT